jgi:hypothetical protein
MAGRVKKNTEVRRNNVLKNIRCCTYCLYYGDYTCRTVNCEVATKFSISLGKCLKVEKETGNCQFHMRIVIRVDSETNLNISLTQNNYSERQEF